MAKRSIANRFRSFFAADPGPPPAPGHDFWYTDLAGNSTAGVNVTSDTALRVAAVLACVRVIAETVGSLIPHVYRRLEDGKARADGHPLAQVLLEPNPWQTRIEFLEMLTGHAALRGAGYALIQAGPRGSVDQLIPLDPDRVTPVKLPQNRIGFSYRTESGQDVSYTQDEIFRVSWMMGTDGVTPMTPLDLAREAIGLGMAAEQYSSRFYSNDATPGGAITHPGVLTPESRDNMRQSWMARHSGVNQHVPAIFEEGVSWQNIGVNARDAQFLELRQFQVGEIARIFRVPPHMIGDLDKATFSNIEHQSIDFMVHTIRPWLIRWELAILRDLITVKDRYFVEFLVDAILRGDTKARYDTYSIAIQNGIMSPNEARAKENMNPRPGGEVYRMTPNSTPELIEAEAERLRQVCATLVDDALERIVQAESRELAHHLRGATIHCEKFKAWLYRYGHGPHRAHILRTLQIPFQVATQLAGGLLDGQVERTTARICDADWRLEKDPDLDRWRIDRTAQLREIVQKGLNDATAQL